jgi:hypothetical protein
MSRADLDELVQEATVDAYGEDEQLMGFHAMIEQYLAVPFPATVLGVEVTVDGIELTDRGVAAACARGPHRQLIDFLELPVPARPPRGWEWIAAYRQWAGRR